MKKEKFNLYEEANKRRIITRKDYLIHRKGYICDSDGVILDFIPVYHDETNKLVGYYIPSGYKSVSVHFSMDMGLNSLTKLFNKVCFDIGFLNSDKDFKEVVRFCNLAGSYMFSATKLIPKKDVVEFLVTKGMETTEDEYRYCKARKYFFTDKTLKGEDRKRIALINMNKNRSKTDRCKIEEAIEYFIQGDKYISQKDIAKFLGVTMRTVRMNMTPEDKQRIGDRNFELTGCPTMNEYIRCQNIDKIQQAYATLIQKDDKINTVNLANESGVHRVTVSKILKTEKDIFKNVNP